MIDPENAGDLSGLRRDLRDLAAVAPAVPDWPGLVRGRVRRRRRQRLALVAGATVLALGSVAALASVGGRASDRLTVAETSAVPGPTPVPDPTPEPTPLGVPVCGNAPLLDLVSPPDLRAQQRNGIVLAVAPACTRVRVGEPLAIAVTALGDAATPRLASTTIGGGTSGSSVGCVAQAGQPSPEPGALNEVLRHTYTRPGTDVVRVSVDSGCSAFPGEATREVTIEVLPAQDSAVSASADPAVSAPTASEVPAGPGPPFSAAPSRATSAPTSLPPNHVRVSISGPGQVVRRGDAVRIRTDVELAGLALVRFGDGQEQNRIASCAASDPS